jgi:hypothetical protein
LNDKTYAWMFANDADAKYWAGVVRGNNPAHRMWQFSTGVIPAEMI